MLLRRGRILFAAGMSVALVAGLAVAEPSGATTPDTTSPGTGDGPVGVIAIGHSGLTAENSDPERPSRPALENSWATGTNPDVNSIYRRLVEAHPATEGHVANAAVGGAPAAALADQVATALNEVPTPELVIIQTIDGDIRCDGSDPDHVAEFGDTVADVLDKIVTASPESHILMVEQLGRPSPAYIEELVAAAPEVTPSLTGPAPCGFYDADGELVEENFETLTSIIEAYEAEQQRQCDLVPQCRTDEGARAAYVDKLENFSSDWNHLNVAGQAAAAELVWPIVVDMLGLEDGTAPAVSSTELAN